MEEENKVTDLKKEEKLRKKEEKKKKKMEKKANKKPVDKMKIATRIFAILVIFLMVFSVCGSLLYYLIQG